MAVFGDWYQVSILGSGSSGSPPTTGPTLIGGFDGTNLRSIKTDSSGNLKVTGVETVGTPTTGAPVLMGGFDGTNVRLMTTDASGNQMNVGNVASAATDSGNPIKIGGVFQTALPTFTNGQRGNFSMDAGGRMLAQASGDVAAAATDSGNPVKIGGKANSATPSAVSIGQRVDLWTTLNGGVVVAPLSTNAPADNATSTTILRMQAYNGADGGLSVGTSIFNGTSWDRQRNNVDTADASMGPTGTLASSTTITGTIITNYNGRGLIVVAVLTGGTSTSTTIQIFGIDVAGNSFLILSSAAVSTGSTTVLTVYPGCIAAANSVSNMPLPRRFRVDLVTGPAQVGSVTAVRTGCIIL